jgi:hypothetical protein
VRDHVVRILRARRPEEVLTTVAPQDAPSAVRTRSAAEPGQKWT